MKLIIAGTRDLLVDSDLIDSLVRYNRLNVKEVVSGGGGNVDEAGEEWAELILEKESKRFDADWAKQGAAAGPIRNAKMAEYGDALLLIWDGKSSGSFSMKQEMVKRGKPIYEVILKSHN